MIEATRDMAWEKMPRTIILRKGDMVRYKVERIDGCEGPSKGMVGTVLEDINAAHNSSIKVQFNEPVQSGHDCAGSGQYGYCWFCNTSELELLHGAVVDVISREQLAETITIEAQHQVEMDAIELFNTLMGEGGTPTYTEHATGFEAI